MYLTFLSLSSKRPIYKFSSIPYQIVYGQEFEISGICLMQYILTWSSWSLLSFSKRGNKLSMKLCYEIIVQILFKFPATYYHTIGKASWDKDLTSFTMYPSQSSWDRNTANLLSICKLVARAISFSSSWANESMNQSM